MSDTALNGTEPVLDLDAMLEDLHNDFQGDIPLGGGEQAESGDASDGNEEEPSVGASEETDPSPDPGLDEVLPPGFVRFGEEILPEVEVKALLELNQRVKKDTDLASRVRQAVLGQQTSSLPADQEAEALPAWLDPEDQQSVFLYRQQQRIDAELAEMKKAEQTRLQGLSLQQEEARKAEVIDAFRGSMKEFREEHPDFTPEDLKTITDRAAAMGLLEHPEKVGGTLRGGIVSALDTAMWALPQFREKAAGGGTVRTKEQASQDRKQKSSALSSSTGSSPRTQSQEMAPTNREEVKAAALEYIRSGAATD